LSKKQKPELLKSRVDKIRRRRASGESIESIATALGTTVWQVRKALGKTPPPSLDKQPGEAKPKPAATAANVEDPILRGGIIRRLRGGWRNLAKLAEDLRCSPETAEATVDQLEQVGYLVLHDGPRARIVNEPDSAGQCWEDKSPLLKDGWHKIGVVSDSHLCSRYARLDVLEGAYDRFAEEGITDVYHAGNLVDGEFRYNRYELLAHGITDQAMYTLDNYPQRSGITTHYISGECHEGWWMKREGIDFGRYLEMEAGARGRKDLHYLGYLEADVKLVGPNGKFSYMRIFHPGGGTAYAISYRPQKIVESLQGGEKPAVLIVGHFHKQAGAMMIRNVWTILAGCTMDQNPFMRKRQIEAHVGYAVLEMQQDKKGAVRRVRIEETSYYDRGYHEVMELVG